MLLVSFVSIAQPLELSKGRKYKIKNQQKKETIDVYFVSWIIDCSDKNDELLKKRAIVLKYEKKASNQRNGC
ncbi:hypothetical protein D0856_10355 [Vibrio owensii]|nr:hypothetical protein D0856_10355 [Vibrio owensii]